MCLSERSSLCTAVIDSTLARRKCELRSNRYRPLRYSTPLHDGATQFIGLGAQLRNVIAQIVRRFVQVATQLVHRHSTLLRRRRGRHGWPQGFAASGRFAQRTIWSENTSAAKRHLLFGRRRVAGGFVANIADIFGVCHCASVAFDVKFLIARVVRGLGVDSGKLGLFGTSAKARELQLANARRHSGAHHLLRAHTRRHREHGHHCSLNDKCDAKAAEKCVRK